MGDINRQRRVVLVGGGHAHLMAIRQLAAAPGARLDITLVSRNAESVYSGMIPGVIAGLYPYSAAKIPLLPLCQRYHLNWHRADITQLDADNQQLTGADGTCIPYDILSIDTGAATKLLAAPVASSRVITVKPVEQLVEQWRLLFQHVMQRLRREPGYSPTISIVGGGAAAVEVSLALFHRFQREDAVLAQRIRWQLFSASEQLLPSHNSRVRAQLDSVLSTHGFQLHMNTRVATTVNAEDTITLCSDDGEHWTTNAVIQATEVSGRGWLDNCTLARTTEGFVKVNQHLQSTSHPNIFATGDIACFEPHPLPKSGVYAVRQGNTLAANITRMARGEALRSFHPQRHCLSLISLGERRAIASRGWLSASGAWVWRWKDHIDRRFIAQFTD